MNDEEIIKKFAESVIAGEKESSIRIAEEIVSTGVDPLKAIKEGLLGGLQDVGGRWVTGEVFLPEMMESVTAMKAGIDILKANLSGTALAELKLGTVVLGTVQGDIHDIGKNIVGTMLELAGFEIKDIGVDVPAMQFVDKAQEEKADIIGISALMVTSMPFFEDIISILKDMGIREKYKVMIGGGPVTQEYADEIGADGYGRDAEEAVRIAKKLLEVS